MVELNIYMIMKKIKSIHSLIIISLILFTADSCKRDGFLVTESGLHYTIHESYGKPKAKIGDILFMHLIYKNAKDSILFDSKSMGDRFAIELIRPSFKGGIEEALAMLGEGDSASFLMPADSLYEKVFHAPRPVYIHKGEKLRFEVRLNKIQTPANSQSINSKDQPVNAKDEDFAIRKYLAENNLLVSARPSGMVYISFVEGKGEMPQVGDSVVIEYTGTFLTGELFDATSKNSGPLKFKMGDGTMLKAWEEGISLMKEGGRSRLVIPSRLAYGVQGYGPIKPNSTIIYDVQLKKVK